MSQSSPKLVFLHLPRTGGTTLHHLLTAAFPPEQVCPERFMRLRRWPLEELAPFRLFSGHFTISGVDRIPGEKRIATVLRDPRARVISTFQLWRRHRDHHRDGA